MIHQNGLSLASLSGKQVQRGHRLHCDSIGLDGVALDKHLNGQCAITAKREVAPGRAIGTGGVDEEAAIAVLGCHHHGIGNVAASILRKSIAHIDAFSRDGVGLVETDLGITLSQREGLRGHIGLGHLARLHRRQFLREPCTGVRESLLVREGNADALDSGTDERRLADVDGHIIGLGFTSARTIGVGAVAEGIVNAVLSRGSAATKDERCYCCKEFLAKFHKSTVFSCSING